MRDTGTGRTPERHSMRNTAIRHPQRFLFVIILSLFIPLLSTSVCTFPSVQTVFAASSDKIVYEVDSGGLHVRRAGGETGKTEKTVQTTVSAAKKAVPSAVNTTVPSKGSQKSTGRTTAKAARTKSVKPGSPRSTAKQNGKRQRESKTQHAARMPAVPVYPNAEELASRAMEPARTVGDEWTEELSEYKAEQTETVPYVDPFEEMTDPAQAETRTASAEKETRKWKGVLGILLIGIAIAGIVLATLLKRRREEKPEADTEAPGDDPGEDEYEDFQ